MRRIGSSFLIAAASILAVPAAFAGSISLDATASGAQEVSPPAPPGGVMTATSGNVKVKFDAGLSRAEVKLKLSNILDADVTGAHFHCGRAGMNGPIVAGLFMPGNCGAPLNGEIDCTLTNADIPAAVPCGGPGMAVSNIASLAEAMLDGRIYLNVHSVTNPGGEVRGQFLSCR